MVLVVIYCFSAPFLSKNKKKESQEALTVEPFVNIFEDLAFLVGHRTNKRSIPQRNFSHFPRSLSFHSLQWARCHLTVRLVLAMGRPLQPYVCIALTIAWAIEVSHLLSWIGLIYT